MRLIRSRKKTQEHVHSREIAANCGQLLGTLDAVLPCIYFAHYGVRVRDLRQRQTTTPGLFSLGECSRDAPDQVVPHVGLILPLRLCRDESVCARFNDIRAALDDPQLSLTDRRRLVQVILDATFGGDVRIDRGEVFDGFLALQPSVELFHRLCESFDYVTRVIDNPADVVRIMESARFRWRSYGELMEWFYGVLEPDQHRSWTALTPFFVSGNTGTLASYNIERWAREGLHRPAENPSKWFVIRPGLVDACIDVRLEMGLKDWTKLHLTLDDNATTAIRLSEVFDPFDDLVAWGRAIEQSDLPVQMEIDGEGEEAVLTVLPSDNPERVLLRVTRKYEDQVLLEGIVSRAVLAASIKAELYRFFTEAFDPQGWDFGFDEDCIPTKDRVLSQSWFASEK